MFSRVLVIVEGVTGEKWHRGWVGLWLGVRGEQGGEGAVDVSDFVQEVFEEGVAFAEVNDTDV